MSYAGIERLLVRPERCWQYNVKKCCLQYLHPVRKKSAESEGLEISVSEEELKKEMEEDGADGYVEVKEDEDLTVVDKRIFPSWTLPHL